MNTEKIRILVVLVQIQTWYFLIAIQKHCHLTQLNWWKAKAWLVEVKVNKCEGPHVTCHGRRRGVRGMAVLIFRCVCKVFRHVCKVAKSHS